MAASSSAVHGSTAPASLVEGGQAEAAAGLVLGDGEVPGRRVAGAARGAGRTPAGDDDGAAVIADLAHLEDGRLATPAHGVLPRQPAGVETPDRAGKAVLAEVSAGLGRYYMPWA